MMNRIRSIALLLLALATTSSQAHAAGGGWSMSVEGFYIIDFVIYAGLLWFFLKGPARKFLADRHERIKTELETATRMREEAEKKLSALNELLAQAEGEVANIKQQFLADGEREKARIEAETEVQLEKVQANARKTLEQEMAKLRQQLEKDLVDEVLARTEAKVRVKLDANAQKKLASSFIEDLEKIERLDRAA
jgi:F-type H+-transporting ATPase subunit b